MKIRISTPRIPRPDYRKILPKRKKKAKFAEEKKQLLQSMRRNIDNPDTKLVGRALSFIAGIPRIGKARGDRMLVERAFSFSAEKHRKQKRLSGDPYFTHAFQTAFILSEYGLDNNTIAAALLHDVLEDTDVREEEIKKKFGEEVLTLVKGVTKLDEYSEASEAEPETGEKTYLQSLLSASSKDLRVLLIKLADKLHNLRTIDFLPEIRRKQICLNALEVYAPLAERFGLQKMREEIEDTCFRVLMPKQFKKLKREVERRQKEQSKEIDEAISILSKERVGRRKKFFQKYSFEKKAKNPYFYYNKLNKANKTMDELYDFVTLIILCDSVRDCYEALRIVHSTFYPIPRKLKDYIAAPHHMTYQSIHTSVIGPKGNPLKIYIRTREMNELAERGITVWLREKRKIKEREEEIKPFREISRLPAYKEEFVSALKTDFLESQISVFGPKGETISLPKGSTAIDFAFKFAPRKALRLAQAEINGKIKPLWSELRNGDRIKPFFSASRTIEKEWLDFAKTYYARETIKEEMKLAEVKTIEKTNASYRFTARARNGVLADILGILESANAELEQFSIERVSRDLIEGSILLASESVEELERIGKRLGRIKGVNQINRIK